VVSELLGLGGSEPGTEEPEGGNGPNGEEPGTGPGGGGGSTPTTAVTSYFVHKDGNDSNNGLTEEYPFPTLLKAYTEAAQYPDRKTTIVVLSDLESGVAVTLSPVTPAVEVVVIKGKVAGFAITRNKEANDSVLEIAGGAKIRFENIKVNGIKSTDVHNRAIKLSGAQTEVTLGNGAVITGRMSSSSQINGGSGVFVTGGAKLVMDGGSAVTGCVGSGDYGAGVHVYGSGSLLTINEGAAISENTAYDYGGGVSVREGGAVVMNGGTIRGNKLTYSGTGYGGGVYIGGISSMFTMNWGVISGNMAGLTAAKGHGGGVYLSSGTFAMNGGVIYGSNESDSLKNTAGSGAAFHNNGGTSNGTIVVSTTNYTIGTAP
jgi:hypothetical protein